MIEITRLEQGIKSDINRVVLLPFNIKASPFNNDLFRNVASLSDYECDKKLGEVMELFSRRHRKIEDQFLANFISSAKLSKFDVNTLSERKKILLGAYFSLEYSLEASALFNPSIVPHPDQENLSKKSQRIVMSMRAIGEGHVSSIVFRTGILTGDNELIFDPTSSFSSRAKVILDTLYDKSLIEKKLHEIGIDSLLFERLFAVLPQSFTMEELELKISKIIENDRSLLKFKKEIKFIRILINSNYKLSLNQDDSISDLIIFPHSPIEVHGIEDLRLTLFKEEEGNDKVYYGTYTAYNGFSIMPMLFETKDFRTVFIHTLNGSCAKNKGSALFPRKINGHYTMCSRLDGHNLYIMYSDYIHFWQSATLIAKPKYPWELRLIGNCGSPHETKEGWLLLTHGVGPMRKYSIGAMLLDLKDPTKLRGRLKEPLLLSEENNRDGYVPNVVYTCGSILHNDKLFIPYGVADTTVKFAHLDLNSLLSTLIKDGV